MSGRESGLTTAAVRECFAWPVHELTDEESVAAEAEFDRWFAEVERAAKETGWAEGYGDCWDYHVSEGAIGRQANPYSKTKEEHDG